MTLDIPKGECRRMENKQKRVAFWNRMSAEKSVENESHINHRMRAEAFCQAQGWELVKEYTLLEVPGSKVREHPAYREYRKDVREGRIDALLVTTLKRFARKVRILIDEIEFLRDHKVDFISMGESIDTTTPYGKLIFVIISGLAELESDEVSERIRASVKPRAQRGLPLSGQAPFGYRWVDKCLTIHEPEAEIVRKAFEFFCGIGNLNPTCRRLKAAGFRARNSEFGNTTLRRMLSCTAYIGRHIRNYRGTKDGRWYVKKPEEHVVNDCPRIVDDKTWKKAQGLLKQISFSQPSKKLRNTYLLSGLLHHTCGAKLYGATYRDYRWAKYLCKGCGHRVSTKDLDAAICKVLFDIVLRTDYLEQILKEQGASADVFKRKARTVKSVFDKLGTQDRNLLLKTLLSRIVVDDRKIRMTFWDMPAVETPQLADYPSQSTDLNTLPQQGSVAVKTIDKDALLKTVQIYPGNPADRTAFTFEFELGVSVQIHANFRERLAAYKSDSCFFDFEIEKMAGVATGTISRLMSGRNTPTWATVERLAKALKVDPNYLLWGVQGSLAARVAEIRKRKGFTQIGLARAAGIKQETMNAIERGRNKCPSEETLVRISKALFVGMEQLCPGGIPWRKR